MTRYRQPTTTLKSVSIQYTKVTDFVIQVVYHINVNGVIKKHKAPGKHFRQGLSVSQFFLMFPDDKTAEKWIQKQRWPDELCFPRCGSTDVQKKTKHKTMPFRCREKDCSKWFSVKTGTPMESSKLGCRACLYAIYVVSTHLKGVSSMKLHRDLGVTQKTAWHMIHRIRETWNDNAVARFFGPVEADETYMGGKRKNMPKSKRRRLRALHGPGTVGKSAVVGIKDRDTNEVRARVVPDTRGATLKGFVLDNIGPGAKVYTDDAPAYTAVPNQEAIKHSAKEYVRGMIHTNGVESFWSMLKRAHMGTFHKISPEHLHRYVREFAGRHNLRNLDTLDQMAEVIRRMEGKRLQYKDKGTGLNRYFERNPDGPYNDAAVEQWGPEGFKRPSLDSYYFSPSKRTP